MRALIGFVRLFFYLLACVLFIPVQWLVLRITSGPASFIIPLWIHRYNCRLFNIRVTVRGAPAASEHIVFVGNHLSYLDIEAIGSVLEGSFIAKEDVARWPLFGTLARLQQTLFISRDPRRAEAGKTAFAQALAKPRPLILFAEGTSSNGAAVLPFKSTLFGIFFAEELPRRPVVQPFTLVLTGVDGQAVTPDNTALRDRYAYYGDTVLGPHLWEFAKGRGAELTLVFHPPLDLIHYDERKSLSVAAQSACASGLAFAKQNQRHNA